LASVPIALFYYSTHSIPEHFDWQKLVKAGDFVVYAHLLFLVVFIAVLVRGLDKNNTGRYRARLVHEKLKGEGTSFEELEAFSTRQVGRFKRHFLRFWCAMLGLYFIFAFEPMFSVAADDCLKILTLKEMFRTELFPMLSFVLNNISLIFIFCCFSVLSLSRDPAIGTPKAPARTPAEGDTIPTPEVRSPKREWLNFSALIRRIVRKLSRPGIKERKLRRRVLVWSFILVILALTLAFPLIMLTKIGVATNWSEYPAVFDALSGTINAIVLALLIARLDSKLIGLPSWLICILYFYAGVQPMFVVFELHPQVYAGLKTAVLLVVFIFKLYFFLIIFYSLQTGRMFNYFFCSRALNEHVKTLKAPFKIKSAPKTTPAAPPGGSPPDVVSSPQSSEEITQSQPAHEDLRAIWFQRLGVAAMVIFAGLLLLYASLSKEHKLEVDSSGLSDYVIWLHVILLFIICLVVARAWRKETKGGSLPSDQSRSEVRAELLLKLSELAPPQSKELTIKNLSSRIDDQFNSFAHYFRLFWIALLLLYLAMFLAGPVPPIPSQDCPLRAELASPIAEPIPISEMVWQTKYSFFFFVINNVTVLILFLCFTVLYIPADHRKFKEKRRLLRNYSLLICVLLTLLVPLFAIIIKSHGFTQSEIDKIPTILGAAGGTLNAVAFALLIGRLDSRIIGLRPLLITVLYTYAALQPLFVTFNQPSNLLRFIATSAMIAAFIFKICLVLMVGHVRRSGGLIDYLWFFPVLNKSVNSIFDNQFEIRTYSPQPQLFTFSIFHKNVETYRAAEMCTTRAQCDEAIKTLAEAMKRRENYSKSPKELLGTYWVQVTSDDHLLCESIGLRSQSEIDDLINESIDKVPYCKYDRG
jgi:hypothetical protein